MEEKQYFLGVDVGGTKSHCLIADELGHVVGFGQSGPGNWESVGWDGMHTAIHECVEKALVNASLTREQISGAGFGCAGYDWQEDRAPIVQIIESLGLACPYGLVNDAIIGFLAGAEADWGVVVIAGTGTNCRGRDRNGREGQMTGMSSQFGENGGASEIVAHAIKQVALAWTQRRPETRLSDLFVKLTGSKDVEDMLAGFGRGRHTLAAEMSPLIFQVAEEGDPVAQEVIRWAGRELGDMAVGVIHQLSLENEAFEVVMAGSTFNGSQVLIDSMRETIHAVAPLARLVRLDAPPVVGGVLLGMEQVGLNTGSIRSILLNEARESI